MKKPSISRKSLFRAAAIVVLLFGITLILSSHADFPRRCAGLIMLLVSGFLARASNQGEFRDKNTFEKKDGLIRSPKSFVEWLGLISLIALPFSVVALYADSITGFGGSYTLYIFVFLIVGAAGYVGYIFTRIL